MIVWRLVGTWATKPTAKIRPPPDLFRLAVQAAERLLRSRLRSHLLAKAAVEERRAGREDQACVYEMALGAERYIAVAAHIEWLTVLGSWQRDRRYDDPRRWLRAAVQLGVQQAVQKSAGFVARSWGQYPQERVSGWILEFIASVDVGDLLGGV